MAEIETYLGHHTHYIKTTLEHICPYHADECWDREFGEGVNDIQDRLGNLVLLDKDHLRRSSFADKKVAYLHSRHPLAEQVATYEQWNLQSVNDYQSWLAQQAVQTWRVF